MVYIPDYELASTERNNVTLKAGYPGKYNPALRGALMTYIFSSISVVNLTSHLLRVVYFLNFKYRIEIVTLKTWAPWEMQYCREESFEDEHIWEYFCGTS